MIPPEHLFMQEILNNSKYEDDISNEFSNWMKYRHYPIVSWTEKNPTNGKLSQNFSTTSYSKWWIPTKLVLKPTSIKGFHSGSQLFYVLSSQKPYSNVSHVQNEWIMIDIRQAGKYVSKLVIFIFM